MEVVVCEEGGGSVGGVVGADGLCGVGGEVEVLVVDAEEAAEERDLEDVIGGCAGLAYHAVGEHALAECGALPADLAADAYALDVGERGADLAASCGGVVAGELGEGDVLREGVDVDGVEGVCCVCAARGVSCEDCVLGGEGLAAGCVARVDVDAVGVGEGVVVCVPLVGGMDVEGGPGLEDGVASGGGP